jgi:hypothetical protein
MSKQHFSPDARCKEYGGLEIARARKHKNPQAQIINSRKRSAVAHLIGARWLGLVGVIDRSLTNRN